MDKIVIRDLLLHGIIGINEDERVNKQDILINLTLFSDIRKAAASDNISDAVNYRTITKRIIKHIEESSDFLLEKLVSSFALMLTNENSLLASTWYQFYIQRIVITVFYRIQS